MNKLWLDGREEKICFLEALLHEDNVCCSGARPGKGTSASPSSPGQLSSWESGSVMARLRSLEAIQQVRIAFAR